MHRERPGDIGRIGALLEQLDCCAAERKLAPEHQSGRSGADHHHVGSAHEADASRSVRFAVLVEPICELAAAADRAKPALGAFPGFRAGDDEQLVAGPQVGVGLRDE
jgi:hypothetical protein